MAVRFLFLCAMIAALAGCATSRVGQNFQSSALAQLQPGQTTLQETVALFGAPPADSTMTARGNWIHHWNYIQADAGAFTGAAVTENKSLTLIFSGDDVLIGLYRYHGIPLSDSDRRRLALPAPAPGK